MKDILLARATNYEPLRRFTEVLEDCEAALQILTCDSKQMYLTPTSDFCFLFIFCFILLLFFLSFFFFLMIVRLSLQQSCLSTVERYEDIASILKKYHLLNDPLDTSGPHFALALAYPFSLLLSLSPPCLFLSPSCLSLSLSCLTFFLFRVSPLYIFFDE